MPISIIINRFNDYLMKKLLIITGMVFLSIFAFFFGNIKGYYRFKQYCEVEGGLRVYEPLEKNVGWLAQDEYAAKQAAFFSGVGFVRYTDKANGKTYDVKYIGGKPQRDESYIKEDSNEAQVVRYVWKFIDLPISNELRLSRSGYEVFDSNKNQLAVSFYMIGYSILDPIYTILGSPSGQFCFHEGGRSMDDLPLSLKAISSAFKGN